MHTPIWPRGASGPSTMDSSTRKSSGFRPGITQNCWEQLPTGGWGLAPLAGRFWNPSQAFGKFVGEGCVQSFQLFRWIRPCLHGQRLFAKRDGFVRIRAYLHCVEPEGANRALSIRIRAQYVFLQNEMASFELELISIVSNPKGVNRASLSESGHNTSELPNF